MSYKTFQNGFPLPASDLNNYLMNQVVATFANSTARSSAIASPQEGQVTYLEDTDSYWRWNGSAWVNFFPADTSPQSPNYIINGAFDFWQRGTSFTNPADSTFSSDRWGVETSSASGAVISQQSFSGNELPIAGFGEEQFYLRYAASSATSVRGVRQRVEDVRTLAGQQVTISFWAKAAASTSLLLNVNQAFGTGGSSPVFVETTFSIGTSWQRYTFTTTLGSMSGKTIGANNCLEIRLLNVTNTTFTLDLFGVQLEAGSVATPFRRNANSLQGELAACQRYYWRNSSNSVANYKRFATGVVATSTNMQWVMPFPVQMRATPTLSTAGTFSSRQGDTQLGTAAPTLQGDGTDTISAGLNSVIAGGTAGNAGYLRAENSSSTYLEFIAEL